MQNVRLRFRTLVRCGALLALAANSVGCAHRQDSPPAESPPPATSVAAPAAPASEPGAPEAPAEPPQDAGGASLFVVHQVSDFDAFQKYFESGNVERDQAGVKGYLLSRLDDGRVILHFFADDADKVQAALNSQRMQEYLSKKGAPDASLVWLTKNVVVSLPATLPSGATFSLYYKLHVADFAAFQRAFEERRAFFTGQGVIAYGLHQSVSKDAIAVLHFVANSREKLESVRARPEFAELLALATRESAEKPLIARDVARSRKQ
jgi:hypothetical protein